MSKAYEIVGKNELNGTIHIQGSKNSALAIIVAAILAKDIVVLENVCKIDDVLMLISILKKINVKVSFIDNNLLIDSSEVMYTPLLFEEVKKFRASYYFIGAFLSLFGKVEIFLPGGCKIGKRPIDQHIKGLNAINIDLCMSHNILKANATFIKGGEVKLDIASVGATVNIILASLFAKEKTIIKNAAKEPEIIDLVNFLNTMGANIYGQGSDIIVINPTNQLHKTSYTIMSDRIVAGTYLIYGALLAKKLTIKNIETKYNYTLISTLLNMGVEMDIRSDEVTVYGCNNIQGLNIKTGVYPEFASDLQQVMTSMLFHANKISVVQETLFENRFAFLNEIKKMGGKYIVLDNMALIIPSHLKSEIVSCDDLRGGAALLLACLACEGTSILKNVNYIERGYENIVETLQKVNANIKEVEIHEA